MKLIHAILGVGAASLLPSALAQEPASKEARGYAITINSEVKPVAEPDLRYPAYAGSRALEGACEVTFAVSTAGQPDAIRVGACSSEAFRRSAKATVEQMRFAPRADALAGASMQIRWTFEDDVVQTASLN
jgi:TonB family protein